MIETNKIIGADIYFVYRNGIKLGIIIIDASGAGRFEQFMPIRPMSIRRAIQTKINELTKERKKC
jgi:hypothetical protein